MNPKKLVIASRESLLAMWQAKHIQGRQKYDKGQGYVGFVGWIQGIEI